jgi:hypothetical protein
MNNDSDFVFEYTYEPSREAEQALAEAWDIIFALIMEDYENELRESQNLEVKE